MSASSLIEVVRDHPAAASVSVKSASLRAVLEQWLTDPRGVRHSLPSLVSVLVAGVACGYCSPLALAQAAAGWDQEVLAGHGCRCSPVTGLRQAPSASTLGRLPAVLDGPFNAGILTDSLSVSEQLHFGWKLVSLAGRIRARVENGPFPTPGMDGATV